MIFMPMPTKNYNFTDLFMAVSVKTCISVDFLCL